MKTETIDRRSIIKTGLGAVAAFFTRKVITGIGIAVSLPMVLGNKGCGKTVAGWLVTFSQTLQQVSPTFEQLGIHGAVALIAKMVKIAADIQSALDKANVNDAISLLDLLIAPDCPPSPPGPACKQGLFNQLLDDAGVVNNKIIDGALIIAGAALRIIANIIKSQAPASVRGALIAAGVDPVKGAHIEAAASSIGVAQRF